MGVLFKNTDITIYNRCTDRATGYEKYQRNIIKDVNWQGKHNATVSNTGLMVADSILIFADKLDNYISPKGFKKMAGLGIKDYLTFAVGDKIVKGNIDFEISGVKPNSIADLENIYDDVVNIISVSELPNHWEIEAK